MQNEDRLRAMLSDLGRSTLRGIRKCPKCGTYNGIRGLSCKNKACDMIFKEAGSKKKQSIEVAKLDTGLPTQVFSVRVRDKGPDYRGFVQLPVQQNLDESDSSYLMSALCFVESCQRLFDTNLLKCHERQPMSVSSCQHIQSAMRCCAGAQVLHLDNEVLKSLNISKQMKDAILQLSVDTPGPLVQRVSKSIMVVKCKVTTKHPLGFLHVSFSLSSKLKENNFSCACSSKNHSKVFTEARFCIHYYACIAAFASNEKCMEEFSSFLMKEKISENFSVEINPPAVNEDEQNHLVAIIESEIGQESVDGVLHKDMILPDISQDFDRYSSVIEAVSTELETNIDQQTLESVICKEVLTKKNKLNRVQKREKGPLVKNYSVSGKKLLKKELRKNLHTSDEAVDENKVHMTFIEWLASVTERINQTTHCHCNGKPEPLVFHAPHAFFDCFLERLMSPAVFMTRKRLPNLVTTFTRKNTPALGTFHNYTWHISNILQAKAVFDTPLMLLNLRREFILKPDETYDDIGPSEVDGGILNKEGEPIIKPEDYKTYLKLGKMKPDQDTPSVLSIDWTPNILPISKIGELKITFDYDHTHQFVSS